MVEPTIPTVTSGQLAQSSSQWNTAVTKIQSLTDGHRHDGVGSYGPLYISSGPQDEATVGIMIDSDGRVLESHEGNDEATPETVQIVNRLVNPNGKPVRVYGLHGTELCHKIDETGYLPANLYVSPDRTHAGTHWQMGQDRSMFTGIINLNDVSQESEIDWKTMGNTKIEIFRWL